ncbi:hypothetical protein B0F90DRAFT_1883634 [Multifurca ochricompacta]|uniref:Uncharacterized protein n=1 Tax=Multifurca ochricompacta TaxID=376703 RepID=A0AAD4LSU7_9AGAM|nr:hypothetical protein B0F90DRAFT_1883634 [Multifurca ochricompacta]
MRMLSLGFLEDGTDGCNYLTQPDERPIPSMMGWPYGLELKTKNMTERADLFWPRILIYSMHQTNPDPITPQQFTLRVEDPYEHPDQKGTRRMREFTSLRNPIHSTTLAAAAQKACRNETTPDDATALSAAEDETTFDDAAVSTAAEDKTTPNDAAALSAAEDETTSDDAAASSAAEEKTKPDDTAALCAAEGLYPMKPRQFMPRVEDLKPLPEPITTGGDAYEELNQTRRQLRARRLLAVYPDPAALVVAWMR